MRTDRRLILASTLTLCCVMLYPYAIGRAEPQPAAQTGPNAAIPYKDPTHLHFFKYQTYLIRTNKGGETPETWDALSSQDRVAKVVSGENKLK